MQGKWIYMANAQGKEITTGGANDAVPLSHITSNFAAKTANSQINMNNNRMTRLKTRTLNTDAVSKKRLMIQLV